MVGDKFMIDDDYLVPSSSSSQRKSPPILSLFGSQENNL
jgi:hypothetical protein